MHFRQLTQKLLGNGANLLSQGDFPTRIYVPSGQMGGFLGFGAKSIFWEKIGSLRQYTDKGVQDFSEKHEGSTGWEYEMMMAFVNGKFFYSSPTTSKNYTQVSSSHVLKIDMKMENQTLVDSVVLDGRNVGSLRYFQKADKEKRNKKVADGSYVAGFVCHFHSHPQMKQQGNEQTYYHFFSPQDIQSFISSRTPLMGLLGDRLWLIGKTKEFMDVIKEGKYVYELGKDLHRVSLAERKGKDEMKNAAAEFFYKYKLAGYLAEFGQNFEKITGKGIRTFRTSESPDLIT